MPIDSTPNAAEDRHAKAEAQIRTFSYPRTKPETTYGEGLKTVLRLCSTEREHLAVQVVREGGENNLHYHAKTDIVYTVLKGRVRFHGPGDKVYGEFGQFEGLVIPADARYWFTSVGDEPLELFQVFVLLGHISEAKRINVDAAKPWMAADPVLQVYEEGRR